MRPWSHSTLMHKPRWGFPPISYDRIFSQNVQHIIFSYLFNNTWSNWARNASFILSNFYLVLGMKIKVFQQIIIIFFLKNKLGPIFVQKSLQGALIRTGQKSFFCKSGRARIGRATLFWCFQEGRDFLFGFFDFYSFLNRFVFKQAFFGKNWTGEKCLGEK